jgi:hypothetical protein
MLTRRTLLQTIAALPLCGWVRPKKQVDDLGGFLVPKHLESAIASIEGRTIRGERFVCRPSLSLEEVCRLRGVVFTPNEARKAK